MGKYHEQQICRGCPPPSTHKRPDAQRRNWNAHASKHQNEQRTNGQKPNRNHSGKSKPYYYDIKSYIINNNITNYDGYFNPNQGGYVKQY